MAPPFRAFKFFFFNDTATTEIYTLSLHDALPIFDGVLELGEVAEGGLEGVADGAGRFAAAARAHDLPEQDRKSTRLNSSHLVISYAVFCLKKKNMISTLTFAV